MSYNEELQSNNADLEDILATVNDLPEAGRGLSGTTVDKITGIDTYELGNSEIQTADESGITWGDKFHIFCEDNTEVSGDIFHNIPIVAGDDIVFEIDQNKVVKISVQGGGYQTKTDESLNTTDKTIVGAINEIDSKPTYYTSGLIYTLSDDGTYYSVTGFDENLTDTEIKIAPIYKGLPVKEIGASAFKNCFYARNIEIPDSVTIIGTQAFASCTNLYSVTFGENSELEEITGSVFRDSWRLVNVKLPNSIKIIGASAFYNCGLKSIVIPEGVTTIGDYAFENCGLLTTIEIPVSVTSIGVRAFNSSSYATDVFYTGTQAEWEAIDIGEGNTNLPDVVATVEEDENLPEAATFSLRNTRIAKSTIHFSYANNFASVAKKLQKVVEEGGSGNVDLSGYLPLSGGIMTGDINLGTNKGFTGTTASGNNFDIFRVLNSTRLQVGGTYPALELKGKNERPTYNGNDMALLSDIPSEPDIDLTSYQPKTDEALETESKEVVGAINELNKQIGNGSGESMVGTWVFNDILEPLPDNNIHELVFDLGRSIQYTIVGPRVYCIKYDGSEIVYCFEADNMYGCTPGWASEADKNITIYEEPTDEVLIAWIKANAVQTESGAEKLETEAQTLIGAINELNNKSIELSNKSIELSNKIDEINSGSGSGSGNTWVFNDTLTLDTTINCSFLFEFDGFEETSGGTRIYYNSYGGSCPHLVYETDATESWGAPKTVVVYCFNGEYNGTIGWVKDEYKTITLDETITDGAFLAWFKANATGAGDGGDIEIDLTPYQTKEDKSLETDNKEVVGAINELNGKIGGVSSVIVSIWVLNDTLEALPDMDSHELKFISNGVEYNAISKVNLGPPCYGLRYSNTDKVINNTVHNFEQNNMFGFTAGWTDEVYKTIALTEEPTDEIIIAWLEANAVKQSAGLETEAQTLVGAINEVNAKTVPPCDDTNEGQFLRVVNGVATWATIPRAEEATF